MMVWQLACEWMCWRGGDHSGHIGGTGLVDAQQAWNDLAAGGVAGTGRVPAHCHKGKQCVNTLKGSVYQLYVVFFPVCLYNTMVYALNAYLITSNKYTPCIKINGNKTSVILYILIAIFINACMWRLCQLPSSAGEGKSIFLLLSDRGRGRFCSDGSLSL